MRFRAGCININTVTTTFRLAGPADAPAIAALHTESWQRFYRGMFPDDFLDNEASDDRARVWRERFDDPDRDRTSLTILAEIDGRLAGFAHSVYDDDPEDGTLLDNLHVRQEEHRRGIGARLMAETAVRLAESGRSKLYLWVLEDNEGARTFYQTLGGVECGTGTSAISNPALPAVPSLKICWPDVQVLVGLA